MSESSSTKALLILEALARVLESADGHMSRQYGVEHAGYVRDAAKIVMLDAGVSVEELKGAEQWGLDEWVSSLISILYPSEQVEERYAQIRSS